MVFLSFFPAAEFRTEVESLALLRAICESGLARECVCNRKNASARIDEVDRDKNRAHEKRVHAVAPLLFLCTCLRGLSQHYAAPISICADPGEGLGILLEWVPESLHQALLLDRPAMSLVGALCVAMGVSKGVLLMHRAGLIHRDLKPHNILLDRSSLLGENVDTWEKEKGRWGSAGEEWNDFKVKICDFGLSVKLSEGLDLSGQRVGTSGWAAPEVMLGKHHGMPADVFSFAVCLWALLAGPGGVNVLAGLTSSKYHSAVKQGERAQISPSRLAELHNDPLWEQLGKGLIQLMYDCWKYEPEARPSFEEIVGRLGGMGANIWA